MIVSKFQVLTQSAIFWAGYHQLDSKECFRDTCIILEYLRQRANVVTESAESNLLYKPQHSEVFFSATTLIPRHYGNSSITQLHGKH